MIKDREIKDSILRIVTSRPLKTGEWARNDPILGKKIEFLMLEKKL